ncbi:MAG TPA: PF20097 family protein [Allosphingosinicella sp.]|uniref:PF20097 family protein n=1 Tax=Allosphingosinicella sp. TaxID=2823234 RepID=UPI002ED90F18
MTEWKYCPKCEGEMADGYTVDQGYGTASVPTWREGEPRKSIWVGLKLGGTTPIEITTWRCRRCGYLESYAPGA